MMEIKCEIEGDIRVCQLLRLSVKCIDDESEDQIGWSVKLSDNNKHEEHELLDLRKKGIILGQNTKLQGREIEFVVPKEWGQKEATFKAYIIGAPSESVTFETRPVLDHIVAAFFRLDNKNDKPMELEVAKELGGKKFWGAKTIESLFHHQGLYREGDRFYISVSTSPGHSAYIYQAAEVKKNKKTKTKKGDENGVTATENAIHLDKNDLMKDYTHPGGIQVAGNILAVGLEKYWFVPVSAGSDSLIYFFDLKAGGEYEKLTINQTGKGKNKVASALAIAQEDKKYTVANRTSNKAIDLYEIEDLYPTSPPESFLTFDKVGEYQNINLFVDDNKDMYLFGMGTQGYERKQIDGYLVYYIDDYDYDSGSHYHSKPSFKSISDKILEFSPDKADLPDFGILFEENILDMPPLTEWRVYRDDCSLQFQGLDYFCGKKFIYTDGWIAHEVVVYKIPIIAITQVGKDCCYIFKINRPEKSDESNAKSYRLEATWIDETTGKIATKDYTEEREKNALEFTFKNSKGPSFHWASCLYLEREEDNETNKKEKDGFNGKFTLYAVAKGIKDNKIDTAYFE